MRLPHLRWLLLALTLALAVAARGAEARLVIPHEFVWIEFNASTVDGTEGGSSIILAKRGDRVRIETLGEGKQPTRWYDGRDELSPADPKRRETKTYPPTLFALFKRTADAAAKSPAPMRRAGSLRGVPSVLFLARHGKGESEALWIERDTGHPLRFVLADEGGSLSWTEVFPVAVHVAERLLEPSLEGPSLREVYAAHIKQARERFAAVTREQTWKKDIEGAQRLFPR